jgi:uroporphyrinogen III methyltransferase/synthase
VSEGKVFFVGAGPGDPGLITVRGKQLIDSADAVVYDALANSVLLPPGARATGRPELYYVGKRGGSKVPVTQDEINELLVKLARSRLSRESQPALPLRRMPAFR